MAFKTRQGGAQRASEKQVAKKKGQDSEILMHFFRKIADLGRFGTPFGPQGGPIGIPKSILFGIKKWSIFWMNFQSIFYRFWLPLGTLLGRPRETHEATFGAHFGSWGPDGAHMAPRSPQEGPGTNVLSVLNRFLVDFWSIFDRFVNLINAVDMILPIVFADILNHNLYLFDS